MTTMLLMSVYGDGAPDYSDYGDIDRAYVELTSALCESVVRRAELVRRAHEQDDQAYELFFWDYNCVWYEKTWGGTSGEDDDEAGEEFEETEEPESIEDGTYALVKEFKVPESRLRSTEIDQMAVNIDAMGNIDVRWICSPKHSSCYVSTDSIPLKVFAETLAEANGLAKDTPSGIVLDFIESKGD